MENASKALIIAGAILISILLISIGIILVNSGRNITDTGAAQMTSQEIQTFNAQFTPYEGTRRGSEIRGLWNAVQASNGVYAAAGHKVIIKPDTIPVNANPMQNYDVYLYYGTGSNSGYIYGISVVEQGGTPVTIPEP